MFTFSRLSVGVLLMMLILPLGVTVQSAASTPEAGTPAAEEPYNPTIDPTTILERSLAESARLIERWHGVDGGRLRYAVTPRFAVSCTAELLRESAALAAATGAYWQTHVSEDRGEIADIRPARSAGVALAAKSRSNSAMLKVECLPPMKPAQRAP